MSDSPTTQAPPVGRFAPSPTGPLHFGSLVAALGSYLFARHGGGRWLVRIEDLDLPRVVDGAADEMLGLLDYLGLGWDGEVVWQSRRFARYQQVLDGLRDAGQLFACGCTRREILASAPHQGEDGPIYPGTCRDGLPADRAGRSLRLRVPDRIVGFQDGLQGWRQQNLQHEVGDFVLHRADGVFAYQLAVVVDDLDAGVSQVVRGADLLWSTPRQIYLYQCLGAPPPAYVHLPLVMGGDGEKLSKRHGPSAVVNRDNGTRQLWAALAFLGQSPPFEARGDSAVNLLEWALRNFRPELIPVANRCLPAE